ncbi:shikimate kinase [Falsiporphyromonas endometrii]|uniref:Shikimate kinase n=1 Tax=Falsiporphyromonas endometrii TaxID=1387297 RepID=A0ABV9K7P6_9PORP
MLGDKPIFIIGYMGSGKSTIGRKLADELNFNFIDTDFFIENRFRQRVQDMFKTVGEETFRKREHMVIEELSGMTQSIIATGGGLPCFYNNMEIIKTCGISIYLEVSNEILTQRLELCKRTRPSVKDKSGEELFKHVEEGMALRAPIYQQADIIICANKLMTTEDEKVLAKKIASQLVEYDNK